MTWLIIYIIISELFMLTVWSKKVKNKSLVIKNWKVDLLLTLILAPFEFTFAIIVVIIYLFKNKIKT